MCQFRAPTKRHAKHHVIAWRAVKVRARTETATEPPRLRCHRPISRDLRHFRLIMYNGTPPPTGSMWLRAQPASGEKSGDLRVEAPGRRRLYGALCAECSAHRRSPAGRPAATRAKLRRSAAPRPGLAGICAKLSRPLIFDQKRPKSGSSAKERRLWRGPRSATSARRGRR